MKTMNVLTIACAVLILAVVSFLPASADTVPFNPTDDATVQKNQGDTNKGGETTLVLRVTTSAFSRQSYLKFNVTGLSGAVTSAKLKLYSDSQSGDVWAKQVADTTWQEMQITWNNKPDMGATIDTVYAVPSSWNEFDVTTYVTGEGTYSIGLDTPVDAVGIFDSKEGTYKPVLEIVTSTGPNPPVWYEDPFTEAPATVGEGLHSTISDDAYDPDPGDTLTFSRVSGPTWLSVGTDGTLSGTPGASDEGTNNFTVRATDSTALYTDAAMQIQVADPANAPTVKIYDRNGTDVSDQTLINSDHIHIVIESNNDITTYEYKYLSQATEPTSQEWDAAESLEFFEDLYFFRESTNQWVRIYVEDDLGGNTTKVCGVQSGTLSGPPDNPINPWDYHDLMGIGFDTSCMGNLSLDGANFELNFKKAGLRFIRHRTDVNTDVTTSERENIIRKALRHGLACDFSLSASIGLSEPPTAQEMQNFANWWNGVSQHYQNFSHLLSFESFTEVGGRIVNNQNMQDFEDIIMPPIRTYNPTRIVIHCPGTGHTPSNLVGYSLRSQHRTYGMVQVHQFAGGFRRSPAVSQWTYGTAAQKQNIIDNFNYMKDYESAENVPTYWGAFMPWARNHWDIHTLAQVVEITRYFCDLSKSKDVPAAFNAAHDFYDPDTNVWEQDYMCIVDSMNPAVRIDSSDSDCDGVSDATELAYTGGPLNPFECDSDSDGMRDNEEIAFGFDPLDRSDGVSGLDIWGIPHGAASDSDGDGMPNSHEVYLGTYSIHASPSYPFDPFDSSDGPLDYDSDGMKNADEVEWCFQSPHLDAHSDWYPDSLAMDGDNLDAYEEVDTYGTHPWWADTDDDGMNDNVDPDPLNPPRGPMPNSAPYFNVDPFSESDAEVNVSYAASLVDDASDPDGRGQRSWTFTKNSGPSWLSVSSLGVITGTPGAGDVGVNTFSVRITDGGGLFDDANLKITVVDGGTPPDTTPPANPTGLAATPGDGQVSLDWNDNTEGDLDGYNVYRSTTTGSGYSKINGSLVGASTYTDGTVSNGTTYYYVVTAVDTSTNESGYSNEDSATPQGAPPDTTPPANPTGLAATAGNEEVSLDWNDNTEGDLDGYNVYRSTTQGSGYSEINGSLVSASAYTDSTVTNGTTYYYVVTAVDTSTNESGYSNEDSAMPEAPSTPDIYVYDITMGGYESKTNYYCATATVWIKDDSLNNINGATVYGTWSGATKKGDDEKATETDGKAILTSSAVKGGGTFTFTVTNVTATGYNYNSSLNNEDYDSITLP